jgi:hypothetical protein
MGGGERGSWGFGEILVSFFQLTVEAAWARSSKLEKRLTLWMPFVPLIMMRIAVSAEATACVCAG